MWYNICTHFTSIQFFLQTSRRLDCRVGGKKINRNVFSSLFESRNKKTVRGRCSGQLVNVINGRLESATAFDGCPAMERKTTVGLGDLG